MSDSGSVDPANGKVKFGPFFDTITRAFTYELTPPANANGIYTFTGIGSAGGTNSFIGGASSLDLFPRHPADNNPLDGRITIGEVTAYGAAWQAGSVWPQDPNPIPISYVTRAGALWKGGETYRFDSTVASAPLWWANTGVSAQSITRFTGAEITSAAQNTPGVAEADLPAGFQRGRAITVVIRVQPGATVQAHATEDRLPDGWTMSGNTVSAGGAYDGVNRKVKWGPFFDNTPRVLSYDVQPGTNTAAAQFVGVSSFDGVDTPIKGRRVTLRGPWIPEATLLNTNRNIARDGFRLLVQGEAGRQYVLEYSVDFRAWIPLVTNFNGATDLDVTDTGSTNSTQRYYRVIER